MCEAKSGETLRAQSFSLCVYVTQFKLVIPIESEIKYIIKEFGIFFFVFV